MAHQRQNIVTVEDQFDIEPGETVRLVGQSGSENSVTSMAILQILPEDYATGSILFRETELQGADRRARRPIRGNRIS